MGPSGVDCAGGISIVVLLGRPGAGKGTQASLLVSRDGYKHVSTGEILRAAISSKSPMGLEVKDIVESGKLVPDALVVGLIKDFLDHVSAGAKIVFDGFPRNVSQANVFLEMLSSGELGVPTVVEMRLGGDTAVDRIKGRSGESERADDDDTVVHARMSVYKEQTEPMIDFFREKGILKTIDGSGTVDTVYSRLSDVLRLINH